MASAVLDRKDFRDFSAHERLQQGGGAFVTLHRRGRLRGCVGQLPGAEPLLAVVAHCAGAAALDDPRFNAVTREELSGIQIELSILSPLENITPEKIEAGKHGLVVSREGQRGVLLPQVAREFNWGGARFLEETCLKAGLEHDAWKDPQTRVQAFTAEVFNESEFPGVQEP